MRQEETATTFLDKIRVEPIKFNERKKQNE